ncbi:hypothetical protein AB0K98_03590 [Streptomyces werraensis]|uniref:Uncharacterized protein n=1 Tax=Streptomyces cellulosae TaxID=1968 RepID=A0ABW6JFL2_STRCE
MTTVHPSMVNSPIHDSTRTAGLSLDGVTTRRAPRDVATTRRGRAEMAPARHAPALADRVVRRTVAARVAAGAFAEAPLAEGLRRRHGWEG